MSLSKQLKIYLKNETGWISGSHIERIQWQGKKALYKPYYVSRELRRMAEEEVLLSKLSNGTVFYRYNYTTPNRGKMPSYSVKPPQSTLYPIKKEFAYDR